MVCVLHVSSSRPGAAASPEAGVGRGRTHPAHLLTPTAALLTNTAEPEQSALGVHRVPGHSAASLGPPVDSRMRIVYGDDTVRVIITDVDLELPRAPPGGRRAPEPQRPVQLGDISIVRVDAVAPRKSAGFVLVPGGAEPGAPDQPVEQFVRLVEVVLGRLVAAGRVADGRGGRHLLQRAREAGGRQRDRRLLQRGRREARHAPLHVLAVHPERQHPTNPLRAHRYSLNCSGWSMRGSENTCTTQQCNEQQRSLVVTRPKSSLWKMCSLSPDSQALLVPCERNELTFSSTRPRSSMSNPPNLSSSSLH